MDASETLFIRALRRQPVPRPPVWIMRQAGRYMPEFRALRAKHPFLEVCRTPDLATEVTLQPFGPIGVDAAIIFSDILVPLVPMGMELVFDEKGPHLPNPIREARDVAKLRPVTPAEDVAFLGEALAQVKRALPDGIPLIGFAGAPWTLAAYMIEGGGSKNYDRIKRFMYNEPQAFHDLMDRVATMLVDYLRFQAASGADVLQLFESWGGVLSPNDFRTYALPYTTRVIAGLKDLGVPVIHYMNGCGHVLEDVAATGADALGVDWRLDLGQAFDRVGDRLAIQGNMDPCMLYAPIPAIEAEVRRLHALVAGRPGHVFNLGHGILPDVPVAHAQAFVQAVKALAGDRVHADLPGAAAYLVPRDILARYDVAGPRYTSYPTAPEWDATFGEPEALAAIAANNAERAGVPLSLYVHVPFCHKLCYFCGCNMLVTQKQDLVAQYLDAIEAEIARVAARMAPGREVVQIHWGGGTPTYLDPAQLERLFGALARHFVIRPDAEISLELHPAVTSFEQLATLRRLGFNRVSMGIQDFDAKVQEAVNRIQPYELTRDLIAECRRLGFLSVNTDLMYGLPHQTVDGFRETLAKVETLRPDRIALFSYAHVPWLKKHQAVFQADTLPAPATKLEIFEVAIRALIGQGYRYIGMDHFALPEDEFAVAQADGTLRRNFMGYTTCADSDLYAFGPSSIADLDRAYLQNERLVPAYVELVGARELPVVRGMALSDDDRVRREVINRLFCRLKVDKAEIAARFGIDFDAYFAEALASLAPHAADGLVTLDADALRVTPRGQILLRNVAMAFDAYLAKTPPEGRRFSRTV